ncbi:hypothetical protein ACWGKQ_35805 [Streptomyces sp. NPDC054770]
MDEREWPDITVDGPSLRIPFVEPDVRELVAAGRLIGMPAVLQARTGTRDGCMLVSHWTVTGMELMTSQVAPWPGMELRLRAKGPGPDGAGLTPRRRPGVR